MFVGVADMGAGGGAIGCEVRLDEESDVRRLMRGDDGTEFKSGAIEVDLTLV